MAVSSGVEYFPSWMEISITMLIVAVGFGVFALAVKKLVIFVETEAPEGSHLSSLQIDEASLVREPAPRYPGSVAIEQ
jgi:hypothetical protein